MPSLHITWGWKVAWPYESDFSARWRIDKYKSPLLMLLILRPVYQSSPDPNQSKLELVQRNKRVNHLGCDVNWYCIFSPSPRHTYRVANIYATSWGLTFTHTPLILSLEYSFTKIFLSQTLNTDSKLWGFTGEGNLIVIISDYWSTKVSISKTPALHLTPLHIT